VVVTAPVRVYVGRDTGRQDGMRTSYDVMEAACAWMVPEKTIRQIINDDKLVPNAQGRVRREDLERRLGPPRRSVYSGYLGSRHGR